MAGNEPVTELDPRYGDAGATATGGRRRGSGSRARSCSG